MCGFIGHFSFIEAFDAPKFAFANNMVKHRGPDDYGYLTVDTNLRPSQWCDEKLADFCQEEPVFGGLGFRRLSIIDLSRAGRQPMSDPDGLYWIVFNGEVYNYTEIRDELIKYGHDFRSKTDTEVVLYSYILWGEDCVNRFNGMWSFCILDLRKKLIFCSRDRLGIKPFYYFFDGIKFVFGSEVKQILPFVFSGKTETNRKILFDFLAVGSYGNESNETFFEGIYRLEPGHNLTLQWPEGNRLSLNKTLWWDLPVAESCSQDEEQICEQFRYLFEDSIRLRLRTDVPLGASLSGGLDSSGIVTFVDKFFRRQSCKFQPKIFTITNDNPELDESDYAKQIVRNCNFSYYQRNFSQAANINELGHFIWHHDEPLLSASIFGSWELYKFIKESGVTVALDGQGADELLGGYYAYPQIHYLLDLLADFRFRYYFQQTLKIARMSDRSRCNIIGYTFLSWFKEKIKFTNPKLYHSIKYSRALKPWFTKTFYSEQIDQSPRLNRSYHKFNTSFSSLVQKESYELIRFTNLPGILRQVDRNSMAFSVEARVPFLDHRLVEFLFRLPYDYKLRDGLTKYVYRKSMEGILPNSILSRTDKIGFGMPEFDLLRRNQKFVKQVLSMVPMDSEVFNIDSLSKNIMTSIQRKSDYNPVTWRIINAICWQNQFNVA